MENISIQQFWTGIAILINNYHAINRKLCACVVNKVEAVPKGIQKSNKIESEGAKQTIEKSTLMQQVRKVIREEEIEFDTIYVHFKCLSKKEGQESVNAIGLLDFTNNLYRLTFACDHFDDFQVSFKVDDRCLAIERLKTSSVLDSNCRWSEFVLKPKLLKWCRIAESNIDLETVFCNDNSSLRLVDIEKYNRMYKSFKVKYSEKALKLWTDAKESTDPLKFIYEDLAIAAYLITLWQSNELRHSPRAFADLGCGNGLLVYILIEEGFSGYGYDIRARKIWSLYPSHISQRLIEHPIEPFKFQLPSEVDWLIGNHSDELSPWLPVLAAISHYQMSYFLLPCCAFEFSGNKFQRRNSTVSAYKDFCDYAVSLSNRCGFVTEKDRLKIPSTKRMAIVGRKRKHSQSVHSHMVDEVKEFVKNEQLAFSLGNLPDIKLRDKVESVRNCTQIDKSILDKLVFKIFLLLLNNKQDSNSNEWQCGRSLTMGEIVQNLDKEDLSQIKSECGGLKTLLRNKHEIFELYKPDFVKIRKPELRLTSNTNKSQTIKKRKCFFHENHPQGCPLSDAQCTFLH